MRAVWIAVVLGTIGTARADVPHLGDASEDLLDPRSIAMGEAGRGLATGESSIALNPSGVAFNHELALEVDYGYRFSDSASIVNASACDSTNAVPGCFYYHYTGASPDSGGTPTHSGLHVFGATLAYPVSPNVAIGVGPKFYHFDTDDLAETGGTSSLTLNNFGLDAGATAHLGSMLSIGAAGYNLIGPSVELPRALGGGISVKPFSMLTLAFDSRWLIYNGDHSARFGGGANLMLSESGGQYGFPLSAGVLHDDDLKVTYLSGGLGLTTMGYALDVTARFSVSGPNDTEIIASLRLWPVPRGNM
ncbi:MAG TPA: hypothetical protein VGL61_24385 [Kofleriaceae bacterium]|jgi:hypothetical protein